MATEVAIVRFFSVGRASSQRWETRPKRIFCRAYSFCGRLSSPLSRKLLLKALVYFLGTTWASYERVGRLSFQWVYWASPGCWSFSIAFSVTISRSSKKDFLIGDKDPNISLCLETYFQALIFYAVGNLFLGPGIFTWSVGFLMGWLGRLLSWTLLIPTALRRCWSCVSRANNAPWRQVVVGKPPRCFW